MNSLHLVNDTFIFCILLCCETVIFLILKVLILSFDIFTVGNILILLICNVKVVDADKFAFAVTCGILQLQL